MRFRFLVLILLFLIFIGCKSTATLAEIDNLKKVVVNGNYEFIATAAKPMLIAGVTGLQSLMPPGSNWGNINLNGNTNFLVVKNDSIHLDMPYFGERRMGNTYSTNDVGLKFNGIVKDITTRFNNKKNSYIVTIETNTSNEFLNLTLTLFANKFATLKVVSSQRSLINYSGNWEAK